ncbi:MAG: peptidoglycan editing factor PgeF [Lachnospiraceae bacterium]|nr:peptidoglycan editing factor PgeF [Lachnospiraceae bacterium]
MKTINHEYSKIKYNEGNVIPYFSYEALDKLPFISHLFTTRLGGVSKDHLSSLNLSYTRGDDDENVTENFRRVAKEMHITIDDIVLSHQTHTNNVRVITEADKGKGITKPLDYSDVDGMITNVKGICLSTFYADCVPLYFVDPVNKAIGLSHSGWKGTVTRIGKETIEAMAKEYGSNPRDILVAIGPSICMDCYEISEDVAERFIEEFGLHNSIPDYADLNKNEYKKVILAKKPAGKYQLNLWEANIRVFLDAGILPEHISLTNVCTCCNSELLFSHRKTNGQRGNLGAFLMLK